MNALGFFACLLTAINIVIAIAVIKRPAIEIWLYRREAKKIQHHAERVVLSSYKVEAVLIQVWKSKGLPAQEIEKRVEEIRSESARKSAEFFKRVREVTEEPEKKKDGYR